MRPAIRNPHPKAPVLLIAARAIRPSDLGPSEDQRVLSVAVGDISLHYAGLPQMGRCNRHPDTCSRGGLQ